MVSFSSLSIWDLLFKLTMSQFSTAIALGSDDTPIAPSNQTLPEHPPGAKKADTIEHCANLV